jgi:hypothetical protein
MAGKMQQHSHVFIPLALRPSLFSGAGTTASKIKDGVTGCDWAMAFLLLVLSSFNLPAIKNADSKYLPCVSNKEKTSESSQPAVCAGVRRGSVHEEGWNEQSRACCPPAGPAGSQGITSPNAPAGCR